MSQNTVYTAGEHGNSVSIYERKPGGSYYIRIPRPDGTYLRKSLKHRDLDRAKSTADRQAAKLREGKADIAAGRITLREVLKLYEELHSPRKSEKSQTADERRIALFQKVWRAGKDPYAITLQDWQRFEDLRATGAIDSHGRPKPEGKRESVSAKTVYHDLAWIRHVLRWAADWRTEGGSYLLRENPVRGFPLPDVKNQKRPVATRERYEALREKGQEHQMRVYREGTAWWERSYFVELLDLVVHTGRRIGAVIQLRYSDLRLEENDLQPHGAIQWPGETDKQGKDWAAPLHPSARAALDRQLEREAVIGEAYLFPGPRKADSHVHARTVERWMKTVEEEAKVEHLDGGLWHPYRRMWASERRHLPDVDVARAGGWSDPRVMKRAYQHADEREQYGVVMGARERRESGSEGG